MGAEEEGVVEVDENTHGHDYHASAQGLPRAFKVRQEGRGEGSVVREMVQRGAAWQVDLVPCLG